MSYGFKLNLDQAPPAGDLTLKVNISSSEISTSYTMTGSTDDNFIGDGIYAFGHDAGYSGEPTDIYNDTVTYTSESQFVLLSGISQSVISDIISDESKYSQVSVKINGQDAPFIDEGWILVLEGTVDEPIKYAGVTLLQSDDVFNFYFKALQEDPDAGDMSPLPGDYTVEIKYPAHVYEFSISVNDLTEKDIGSEYKVSVSLSEISNDFKEAVAASACLFVDLKGEGGQEYLDIEAKKLYDALETKPVVFRERAESGGDVDCNIYYPLYYHKTNDGIYGFTLQVGSGQSTFSASSDTEKPAIGIE